MREGWGGGGNNEKEIWKGERKRENDIGRESGKHKGVCVCVCACVSKKEIVTKTKMN